MLAAVALALWIVAAGCTKEKSSPQPKLAKKEIEGTNQKAVPIPRVKLFTGRIEALDEEAGTLILKGPKGAMRFLANEKVKKHFEDLNIGDKVIVKHADNIALSIVRPRTGKSTLTRMASPPGSPPTFSP